jgi:hypothetical protein
MSVLVDNAPAAAPGPRAPSAIDRLPRPVRAALERSGGCAKTVAVAVSCDTTRATSPPRERPHGGAGYYCYLAVHPLDGRKKDTFMGIASDPLADLFARNHGLPLHDPVAALAAAANLPARASATDSSDGAKEGETQQRRRRRRAGETGKDTHLAAPYWKLAAVLEAPPTVAECQQLRLEWTAGTRGVNSKIAKARKLAHEHGLVYYGRDEQSDDSHVEQVVVQTGGKAAAAELTKVRDALAAARIRDREWEHSFAAVFTAAGILSSWLPALLGSDVYRSTELQRLQTLFAAGRAPLSFAVR